MRASTSRRYPVGLAAFIIRMVSVIWRVEGAPRERLYFHAATMFTMAANVLHGRDKPHLTIVNLGALCDISADEVSTETVSRLVSLHQNRTHWGEGSYRHPAALRFSPWISTLLLVTPGPGSSRAGLEHTLEEPLCNATSSSCLAGCSVD